MGDLPRRMLGANDVEAVRSNLVGGVDQVDGHSFVPAVARVTLNESNTACTGTLVAANKVLTAAHCLCPRNGINPQTGSIQFADNTGHLAGPSWALAGWVFAPGAAVCGSSWYGVTSNDPMSHSASDVAVLTLVPNAVAPALPAVMPVSLSLDDPRLNFGPSSPGHTLLASYWSAGFGTNFSTDFLLPDSCVGCGIRRSGRVNNLVIANNPCSTFPGTSLKDPFPQDCWNGWLWNAASILDGENVEIAPGDSGGPLMFSVDSAQPAVVAGVASSFASDFFGPPLPFKHHTKWATTGDNDHFLFGAVGLPFTVNLAQAQAGAAVFTLQDLNINDRGHVVGGQLLADRFVILGTDSVVGDVHSRDQIILRDRASAGNVTARRTVTVPSNAHAASVTQGRYQKFEDFSLGTVQNLFGVAYPSPIAQANVGPNAGRVLPPGIWGDFIVFNNSTLTPSDGLYIFHNLDLESGSTLTVTGSKTWVYIATGGNIIMRGVINANASNLFFGIPSAATVTIGNVFNGTLVAPNAPVNVQMVKDAVFTGAVFSRTFTLFEGEFLRFAPFSGRWVPTCGGIGFNPCS
jgi:hypothetical protein